MHYKIFFFCSDEMCLANLQNADNYDSSVADLQVKLNLKFLDAIMKKLPYYEGNTTYDFQ